MFARSKTLVSLFAFFISAWFGSADDVLADDRYWVYEQSTGKLSLDGEEIGTGYSGHGEGVNNPKLEDKRDVGPIPRGMWSIGKAFKHDKLGPLSMKLEPIDHNAHGRDEFLIHGDNSKNDRSASHGCIILGPDVRKKISESTVNKLKVIE